MDKPPTEAETEPPPTTPPPPPPLSPTTDAPSTVLTPGTYVVGSELEPGIYRASRYWARLDANKEIIDNDLVGGHGVSVVTVQPADAYLKISGSAVAVVDSQPIDPIANGFDAGTYLVGLDIQPGRYRITRAEGAYFARLDDRGQIIENDLRDGSVLLVVPETDWALKIRGTIDRI